MWGQIFCEIFKTKSHGLQVDNLNHSIFLLIYQGFKFTFPMVNLSLGKCHRIQTLSTDKKTPSKIYNFQGKNPKEKKIQSPKTMI